MVCLQSFLQKAKFQSFLNTHTLLIWSQQSAAFGSSKQLPSTLKLKMIDTQKAEEDQMIAKCFQAPFPQFRM